MRPDKQSVFEPARRKVADVLRSRPGGYWTVDEVAGRLRIHRTVAFDHLEALAADGLAAKVAMKGRRGRPANAYRYSSRTVEMSYPPRQTTLLARVLARSMAAASDPRKVARGAGESLADLDSLGGDYERNESEIHARNCIFDAVCDQAQPLVCGVHAGLIEGSLAAHGEVCSLEPRGPDGTGGCSFLLH